MTKEEKFSLATLQRFTATDFEQYRERGDEFRQRLSSAVIAALSLPECWRVDYEHRQEWGGLHPVHLRLCHHSAPQVPIDIIGPCHESPYWYGQLSLEDGTSVARFYSDEGFDPEALWEMMARLDNCIRAGYTEATALMVALHRGGGVV